MNRKLKPVVFALLSLALVGVAATYLRHTNIPVLEPKGVIAGRERHLIVIAVLLSLIVVVPLFAMLIAIAWRYREGNARATYSPNLDGNNLAETVWWLIPTAIIGILSVITWTSSHQLDPYKTISSNAKPLTIQVVALDWKWLFIYPDQHIASVNFFQIPVNTPINFEITSDAPMNSFWLPALGGQVYAMPGMSTQLHLMASSTGDFNGSSANISGIGFAGMTFVARSSTSTAFAQWVHKAQASPQGLDLAAYNQLVAPSKNNPVSYYSLATSNLYNTIVMKYMMPESTSPQGPNSRQNNGTAPKTNAPLAPPNMQNDMQGMSM